MLRRLVLKKRHTAIRPWAAVLVAAVMAIWCLSALASSAPAPHADGAFATLSPSLKEFDDPHVTNGLTLKVMIILLQIAVVLAAAKLCGALAEALNIPGVLGELGAGMLIGPFFLGALIPVYVHGNWLPLFPRPDAAAGGQVTWPISGELWLVAQLASVVLLFMAGLHTNLKQFLRYVGPASFCAIGGVIAPFFLGAWATAYFLPDLAWYSPQALFIGAIMVATSVGITARVLSDIRRLDTPEGVTILAGAVVDDVLGILVLAVVAAIGRSGQVNVSEILLISVKAVGFWLGLTAVGFVFANKIEQLFNRIKYAGARLALALALCLLCAAAAEMFGLAFIIGAYSIGLALSKTRMAHQLTEDLMPLHDVIVPIFFAAMGMLVDFSSMGQALGLGLVICLIAVVSKVFGCGLPALVSGFNRIGAFRVGIGMLPRGEVALIMAGVGLAGGYIDSALFGVAILMTLVTTVIAPLVLVPAFKTGGSGLRAKAEDIAPEVPEQTIVLTMPPGVARACIRVLLSTAADAGYQINLSESERGIYLLQRDSRLMTVSLEEGKLVAHTVGENASELNNILERTEHNLIASVDRLFPETSFAPR